MDHTEQRQSSNNQKGCTHYDEHKSGQALFSSSEPESPSLVLSLDDQPCKSMATDEYHGSDENDDNADHRVSHSDQPTQRMSTKPAARADRDRCGAPSLWWMVTVLSA